MIKSLVNNLRQIADEIKHPAEIRLSLDTKGMVNITAEITVDAPMGRFYHECNKSVQVDMLDREIDPKFFTAQFIIAVNDMIAKAYGEKK